MTRAEKAKTIFESGYNCAQAVAMAFCDALELDEKEVARMVSGFGSGFGLRREVCGALSGMTFVLGALEGYNQPNNAVIKQEMYDKVRELFDQFEEARGTIICRELLGLDKGGFAAVTSERTPDYYQKRPCPDLVYEAAKLIEDNYF